MAILQTNQTIDDNGTGSSHSGPCTVFVNGNLDGATVHIDASATDANYLPSGVDSQKKSEGAFNVQIYGSYYLRARVSGARENTSVSVVTTQ